MFKLAHISDVHLGPLPPMTIRQLASKRITGFVNWQRNRRKHLFGNTLETVLAGIAEHSPDHLAVTGDLVNLAAPIEIETAGVWLESVGASDFVSVVPGNHDAYVPGALGSATKRWKAYMSGDNATDLPSTRPKLFPYLRLRGSIALIGCSSAIATPPFSASGYFSARQARALASMLEDLGKQGLCRVVMIHHPPIRGATNMHKRLIGIRRFQAAISLGGAELVLHGHTHLNTVHTIQSAAGKVPVIGIASASQGPGGKKPVAGFNLFSISGEAGNWIIARERFAFNSVSEKMELAEKDVF